MCMVFQALLYKREAIDTNSDSMLDYRFVSRMEPIQVNNGNVKVNYGRIHQIFD